jgi:NAD(P)H-flavin reductase
MPTAVLSDRTDAGGGLMLVALDVGPELARAYTAAGQYIEIATAGGRGYFVLAGEVGRSPWELLVKNAGDAANALFSLPRGSTVSVNGPMGTGFNVVHVPSRPVVIAVVGSALAVARPVVASRLSQGEAASTMLFIGLRAPTDIPLANEVAGWLDQGVVVVLCLSRAELDNHPEILPRARRVGGYVQEGVSRAVESGELPSGAVVVVAGPDAMLESLRSFASAHGAAHPSTAPIEIVTNL